MYTNANNFTKPSFINRSLFLTIALSHSTTLRYNIIINSIPRYIL